MDSTLALPSINLDRRSFLKRSGSLVIAFTLMAQSTASFGLEERPRPITSVDDLDSWLQIGSDGKVTLFCGKIEMGQGISTAFAQMVADELDVSLEAVSVVICDTARTPDQGVSSASRGISAGGTQIRLAAAEARQALLELASAHLNTSVEKLIVNAGVVSGGNARVSYAELLRERRFDRKLTGKAKTKAPAEFRIIGKSTPRLDLPSKVDGRFVYVHDIEIPGMVHARVVRPAQVGAHVINIDALDPPRPHITIVRKNDFVAVVAESEWEAVKAARDLRIQWSESKSLPAGAPLADTLRAMPSIDVVFNKKGDVDPEFDKAGQTVSASYLWPFQSHGSIGPSCAVADVRKDGDAIIWSASQDVYRHRDAIAQLLHMDASKVRIIYTHGSGCYGHNGADDAGADAALISREIGRPVRVQWMREDEHAWAPRGSPLLVDLRARLSPEGEVLAWDLKSRSMTFSSRFRYYGKQQSGYVLAAQLAGERADTAIVAEPGRILNTSMTSSTVSPYAFANARTTICALPTAEPHPLRPSELRSVSAIAATFAIESFIDELAVAAKQDPIAFRQAHLSDTRAKDVLADVAKLAGWETLPKQGSADGGTGFVRGRGVALGLNNTYVAAVAEVSVNLSTGEIKVTRLSLAHDCGLIINPDGVKSQIEGNLVQATSRTLFEEVTWDESKITSTDWASYRISKFGEVPETRVSLIDRPSLPSTGAGEPASLPVGAAIGNAVFDAIGIRMRQVPFTPARVKEAMADKLSMQKLN